MSYEALRSDTSRIVFVVMNEHVEEHRARVRGRELVDLRWHWDEAYEITWDGRFRARRLDGSGSVDAGLSLDYRYSLGRDIVLYANTGGVLMGKAIRVPGAEPSMFQGFAGIEYHPNHRDSFVLQVDGSSLVVRTGNAFADHHFTFACVVPASRHDMQPLP